MRLIIAIMLIIALTTAAHALEVIDGQGRSYPIEEADQGKALVKQYNNSRKQKTSRTDLEKKWVARLERQPRLCKQNRTRLVDITYTLPFDIQDKDGRILFAKGHQHNPLVKMTMTSLIIIDGEKKEHIEWAKQQKKDLKNAKILITKGSFLTIRREHNLRVYHLKDQMMDRFKIEKIPCTIIQQGQKLEVTEFRSPEL